LKGEKNALLAFHNNTEEVFEFVQGLKKWDNYNFYAFGPIAGFLEKSGISVVDISSRVNVNAVFGLSLDPVAWVEKIEKEVGIDSVELAAFDFWPAGKMVVRPEFIHTNQFVVIKEERNDLVMVCDNIDYEKVVDWVMEHRPNKEVFIKYLHGKVSGAVLKYRNEVDDYFATKV
jgi:hypothetical protein